ncbi:hypothetical protein ACFVAF_25300 [Streptomyces sp. NPDC057596]|uniref:hypothetical protein n=1 Tax=Streptomyces sp. NPDC057596 TaxID=3346178 RepID=UPI0036BE7388
MTEQQLTPAEIRLAQYSERTSTWSTATYNDGTEKALHEIALGLKAELDRVRDQRKFLVGQIAKKDAASGAGDRALAAFLGGEFEESKRHLEDGSTHTVQALQDAGESCVQQNCTHAREEKRLRQEQYSLRAAVEGVLDEVGYMADDDRITSEVAGELRRALRDALGLRTP